MMKIMSGRETMSISNKNVRFMVTLSKEMKAELEKEADAEGRSISNYIAEILKHRKSINR